MPVLDIASATVVRPLRADDWTAAAEIWWEGTRGGLATFETDVPSWEDWDATHLPGHRLVAVPLDEPVGWAALAPVSARRVYRGVAECSVYVAEPWQGRGIGRLLLEQLVAGADGAGIWTIQASVFPENRASLALHERCGFRVVGTRERVAKRDGIWRDTLLLERRSEVVN